MQYRKETITNWHYKHRDNPWQRFGCVHTEKLRQEAQQNLYWLKQWPFLWNVIPWRSVQCQRRRSERCLHHCSVSLSLWTKRHCGIGTHCRRRTLRRWGERCVSKWVHTDGHFVMLLLSVYFAYLLCTFTSYLRPLRRSQKSGRSLKSMISTAVQRR